MTQFQFETIVRIIKSGAPALANELCEALVNVIEENANLRHTLDVNKAAETAETEDTKEEE